MLWFRQAHQSYEFSSRSIRPCLIFTAASLWSSRLQDFISMCRLRLVIGRSSSATWAVSWSLSKDLSKGCINPLILGTSIQQEGMSEKPGSAFKGSARWVSCFQRRQNSAWTRYELMVHKIKKTTTWMRPVMSIHRWRCLWISSGTVWINGSLRQVSPFLLK